MESLPEIHVKIAEVKTGHTGDILKATLGSCVGIAFVWKEKDICGLAHCLLGETNEEHHGGAKFVNHAVKSLMQLMKINPWEVKQVKAYIAGGGNMMSQLARQNTDHIGQLNVAAARKHLKKYGFEFTELALGGEDGRQIILDCTTGEVKVLTLQKHVTAV